MLWLAGLEPVAKAARMLSKQSERSKSDLAGCVLFMLPDIARTRASAAAAAAILGGGIARLGNYERR